MIIMHSITSITSRLPHLLSILLYCIVTYCSVGILAIQADESSLNDLLNRDSTPYQPTTFLPMKEAFKSDIAYDNGKVVVRWQVAQGYYLYKDRFKFTLSNEQSAQLGEPQYLGIIEIKEDDNFGTVEVFYYSVDIEISITSYSSDPIELVVGYQGCADDGLCYPPAKVNAQLTIPPSPATQPETAPSPSSSPDPQEIITAGPPVSDSGKVGNPIDKNNANSIALFLEQASLIPTLMLFFFIGVGLTFTPCVLPMIPILSSIIVGQKEALTPLKGFLLSSSYVLGMALAFSIVGLIVGLTGERVQIYMQNPWVLTTFAAIFVLLSFSMFGFYELQLPDYLRTKLNRVNEQQRGGHLVGVFVMGMLSALVVSPCVSAPLAGILLYIAKEGNAPLGAAALLSLGLGMGAPLIVLGTSGANLLPKAGKWMNVTKSLFGYALLVVAAYLLRTVLPPRVMMLIWAGLLIIPAIFMGALEPLEHTATGWKNFWKGIGIIMLVYGISLIWGAAEGNSNPLKPLGVPLHAQTVTTNSSAKTGKLPFETLFTNEALNKQLAAAKLSKRAVMIDFYADWCIACVEMEHGAFMDPRVQTKLTPLTLIKLDITAANDESIQLLDRFNLPGPPSLLFFDTTGQRIKHADIMGEMNADQFVQHLDQQVLPFIETL